MPELLTMNTKHLFLTLGIFAAVLASGQGRAQTVYSEDFTGASTTNSWYFFNGACLTAGTSTSTASPGTVPSCKSLSGYYTTAQDNDPALTGGNLGYLGAASAPGSFASVVSDPVGFGALRFTNGAPYGHFERGAILSANTFSTGSGLQVTFKTVTYLGDGGGAGKDGADGISFFLMDGSKAAGIGATGGSLAYSCSNKNANYDGLNGGYIGLGIDEFGNFLNGANLAPGYTGSNTATGDNSAFGYGYKPGRIGMRGAGSISWAALSAPYPAGYGTYKGSGYPYYPSSLATTYGSSSFSCASGTNYNNEFCYSACPTTRSSYPGAPSGGSATIGFNGTVCTYTKSGTTYLGPTPTTSAVTVTGGSGTSLAQTAVQQACTTGNLYNYYDPAAPVSVTTATLTTSSGATNTANPAGILDYAPIVAKELTSFTIANETATTRAQATPIFYNLKVTQDGLLSLAYSTGGAYSYLIKNQSITSSNGTLPATFRFGFAGSTGGDTNVHEIMCFKAASADTSGSSATVNEKQAAKVEAGTQAYFAFYNPNDWTGTLTANALLVDTNGVVSVQQQANWDASCLLTGTDSGSPTSIGGNGGGCATTLASGPTSPVPTFDKRVMLTYDSTGHSGIAFEWANLNSVQQAALDQGDVGDTVVTAAYRLNYLRGDRSNEITTLGAGLYRARAGVLGDIVDSSPSWVGPPSSAYTAIWKDRLQPAATMAENGGTQTYLQFVAAEQGRLNVVYGGANDGFLHGFRAGSFDANGLFCGTTGSLLTDCSSTPNDGKEVLAYMPGSTIVNTASPSSSGGCTDSTHTGTIVQNIRGLTPAIGANTLCIDPTLDYSNTQYGHNFFVDATPGTGDLFYGGTWHTWLVSGLGYGGQAVFALDVTNPSPTTFQETNAANIVIGEWNANTIGTSCAVSGCGSNLGNTFGVPQIRRLHNGNWGVIFGNGFGSASGDAGIFVMSIDINTAAKTFYYLTTGTSTVFSGTGSQSGSVVTISAVSSGYIGPGTLLRGAGVMPGSVITSFGTGTGGAGTYNVSTTGTVSSGAVTTGNGIAYVAPTDLDGDHITDYVYAGDLMGNVWRFDLTNSDPTQWAASAAPLFSTPAGQPITSQLLVIANSAAPGPSRLMIEFGTGQRTQITNAAPESFVSGTQAIYAVWDWNMTAWNSMGSAQYASLAATNAATGLSSPFTIKVSSTAPTATLQQQTFTVSTASTSVNDGTNLQVCWQGSTSCGSGNTQFGWYANLPGAQEQVIFNPVFFNGAFIVNSTLPANNIATTCTINQDTGFTYAVSVANGGVITNAFPNYTKNGLLITDPNAAGVQTNATGSVYVVGTSMGTTNIVYQTVSGIPGAQKINVPNNTKAKRLTWIERR
jgi:type IV pilus assembly protein PilY1